VQQASLRPALGPLLRRLVLALVGRATAWLERDRPEVDDPADDDPDGPPRHWLETVWAAPARRPLPPPPGATRVSPRIALPRLGRSGTIEPPGGRPPASGPASPVFSAEEHPMPSGGPRHQAPARVPAVEPAIAPRPGVPAPLVRLRPRAGRPPKQQPSTPAEAVRARPSLQVRLRTRPVPARPQDATPFPTPARTAVRVPPARDDRPRGQKGEGRAAPRPAPPRPLTEALRASFLRTGQANPTRVPPQPTGREEPRQEPLPGPTPPSPRTQEPWPASMPTSTLLSPFDGPVMRPRPSPPDVRLLDATADLWPELPAIDPQESTSDAAPAHREAHLRFLDSEQRGD